MSDPATTHPTDNPEVRSIQVELEYKHPHHVPSDAEYPSELNLKSRIEDNLSPGLFRIWVKRKVPKDLTVNSITLKGIETPRDFPANIDADELERAVLSICYRAVHEETKERTQFLIRFIHRTPPGQRPKKAELSLSIEPLPDGLPRDSSSSEDRVRDWERRSAQSSDHHESHEPRTNAFQESYSPYSETARQRNEDSWRDRLLRNLPEPARPSYDAEPIPDRRGSLFTPEMMMQFDPERMSPEGQRQYADSILPFAILNNSMHLCFQGFAASIDTLTRASQEQQRLHSLQMAMMMDREKQLMDLPLKFLDVEATNKGSQAEIMRQSHQNYMDALRLRADMTTREKGYEIAQLQSQYQMSDLQRQLFEQTDKKEREEASAFRRDLMRNLGPTLLQGLGLFLEHFGKPQLGAAAKASGMMVEGMMSAVESQSAPPSPSGPPPAPSAGNGIPRRTLRIMDVANADEVRMQPIRSLCRMVDVAFTEEDRARVRGVIQDHEWEALQRAFTGSSDPECIAGLSQFMLSVGSNQERQNQLMATITPGQRELLEKIGRVIQYGEELPLNYEVEVRPRRTVLRQHGAPQPQPQPARSTIPVPPEAEPASASVPVPPAPVTSSVDLDPPRPSVSTAELVDDDVPRPSTPAPSSASDPQFVIAQLQAEIAALKAKTKPESAQTKQLKKKPARAPAKKKTRTRKTTPRPSNPT